MYQRGIITLDHFKEVQFDPYNFVIEAPSSNRSHKYERK